MKNKLLISSVLLFSVFTLSNCGKDCAKELCADVIPPVFSFRIQNGAGQNLLMGPFKVYDTSEVKITAKRAKTGTIENINRLFFIQKNGAGTADSLCITGLTVSNDFSVYYLSLKNVVTDSMQFAYNKRSSECCDLSTYSFTKLNTTAINDVLLPIANGYVIIK